MKKMHILKSWPKQFNAVSSGSKTAELRINDRDYRVRDLMVLKEYIPETAVYTGRSCTVEITHILDKVNLCAVSKYALHDDFAILSVKLT